MICFVVAVVKTLMINSLLKSVTKLINYNVIVETVLLNSILKMVLKVINNKVVVVIIDALL